MSEEYEVVIPFGKDDHWANVCVLQLKDKMGLSAYVRKVNPDAHPE